MTGTKLYKYIDGHMAGQCSKYMKLPVQFLLLLLSRMYTTMLLCAQIVMVYCLFALFLVKIYGLYQWGKPRHVSETWGKIHPVRYRNHSHPTCQHWGLSSGHNSEKSVIYHLSQQVQFNPRSVCGNDRRNADTCFTGCTLQCAHH